MTRYIYFLICLFTMGNLYIPATYSQPLFAHLSSGDSDGLAAIQEAFSQSNPGYELYYFEHISRMPAVGFPRVLFVQAGETQIHLSSGMSSEISVGDIVLLSANTSLKADSSIHLLAFKVPDTPPDSLPAFIRPDWDENITDTPGGCATETGAYRRILLTWKGEVGKYLYHSLNAHRVRIMDSFTHYHPVKGGFDEFYLVQMAMPGAKLITGTAVTQISQPNKVRKTQVEGLLQTHGLQVGDLVYLPRGTIHRGLDGVLAQVITVPGFVPGSEIGVDHFLRQINEKLNLSGSTALPLNEAASHEAVVK